MSEFETKLINTIQCKIIKDIEKQELVTVAYGDRMPLPQNFLVDVYKRLDIEKIKRQLIENLENEMADKIANKLIIEYSNDIKHIMCNRELREDLRFYARTKIKEIADGLECSDEKQTV